MSSSIEIRITSRCNLSCSFCHLKEEMKETRDISLDRVLEIVKDYDTIIFSGGEPLLRADDIFKVMRTYPEKKYTIMTNGHCLTKKNCKEFKKISKKTNVYFVVSFNSTDGEEKSLEKAIEASKNNHLVSFLNSLKMFTIRAVLFPGDVYYFSKYVALLYTFKKAHLEISFDKTKLKDFKHYDAYIYMRFKLFVSEFKKEEDMTNRFSLLSLFDEPCGLKANVIDFDGVEKPLCKYQDSEKCGCGELKEGLGENLYSLFKMVEGL